MKITRIDAYRVAYTLKDKTYRWSRGLSVRTMDSTVVKVNTDAGLVGWGENCPLGSSYMDAYPAGIAAGIAAIGPALIGVDPCQLAVVNAVMDGTIAGHEYVKSPLDIACWDIAGQAAGQPVCVLLGGRFVDDYPLYRPISMNSPAEMADDVKRFLGEGYHRFQLKVGGDPREDIARIEAVLNVTGPDDIVVADANTGWTMRDAARVVHAVADMPVHVEQPCPTLRECLNIRARTRLPFIIDELITGIEPLVGAYTAGAMDGINIKLSRVGGLTKAAKIRDLAQQFGLTLTMEDGHAGDVSTTAVCHLVASTDPRYYFTASDMNSYNDVRIAPDAPFRRDGRFPVPTRPGLGLTVDETVLGNAVLTIS